MERLVELNLLQLGLFGEKVSVISQLDVDRRPVASVEVLIPNLQVVVADEVFSDEGIHAEINLDLEAAVDADGSQQKVDEQNACLALVRDQFRGDMRIEELLGFRGYYGLMLLCILARGRTFLFNLWCLFVLFSLM